MAIHPVHTNPVDLWSMNRGVAIYEPMDDGRDFILKDFNRTAEENVPIAQQNLIGSKITEIFPNVAECGLLRVLRSVSEDGVPRKHPATMGRDNLIMGCRDAYMYRLSLGKVVMVYEEMATQAKSEMTLLDSELRVRAIMESIHAGIVIIDPIEHLIVEANPMALKMIGAERDKVVGHRCHQFICPAEVGECPITDLGNNVDNAERELLNIKGESIPILKTVAKVTLQGREHLLESFLDISQMKALENKLREMATIDCLTGTFSRAHLMELLQNEINRTLRYGTPLSFAIFDIDHFKKINDTHGHQAGDLVLKGLCQLCKDTLRDTDVLGRIGGEEFAILFVENDMTRATMAAERLRLKITESDYECEGTSISCTVSFGVAQFHGIGDSFDMLFKRADEALYKAKNLGRNRVCQPAL